MDKDVGRVPTAPGSQGSAPQPATPSSPDGADPSRGDVCCPNCGEDLSLTVQAALPESTDLTISLRVEPGQLMRLDSMAGIMSSWRDLQIAVGSSMGADTEVFLADMGQRDNEFWFTGRITNVARDTDGSPQGTDAQRQDGEAATAGADEGGIAQVGQLSPPDTDRGG